MKKTTLLLAGILMALSTTSASVFAKDDSASNIEASCRENPNQEMCK